MIDALIARMTLAEKLAQLTMASADMAVTGPALSHDVESQVRGGTVGSLLNLWGPRAGAVQRIAVEETRLGIPLLLGFDVIHGHRTIFPSPLGEAAAFDEELWERTAHAAGTEAAADGLALTFAPMLDVARDPRWGRMTESPGENAWVAARFARAKVRGFQGPHLADPSAIAATAKHFVAYGAVTAGREYAAVDVSDRALDEVYLPPFRTAVAGGVAAFMPGFPALDGIPMTAHVPLLRDRLRGAWGFDGVVVSDYMAVPELIGHGVAADVAEAAALALAAGVDIDMMGFAYRDGLPVALDRGLVNIEAVDAAVGRVLRLKQRLGLFDAPYARGAAGSFDAPSARVLAREAACRSMVLLTNRNDTLPLGPAVRRIAVVGPIAADPGAVMGSWAGAGRVEETVSYDAGLVAGLPGATILSTQGVGADGDDLSGIASAVDFAASADLVILCVGETADMNGEGASRLHPGLPGRQRDLAEAIFATGVPVVTVITAGRPLIEPILFERSAAVLMAFTPGTEAGHALADVLAGRADPGGRLPVTWPAAIGQIPISAGEPPTGRPADPHNRYTARYIDGPVAPQFPFGHGLSYARFRFAQPQVSAPVLSRGGAVEVTAEIVNAGTRAGRTTVFLFIHDPVASVARPSLELRGAVPLALEPGAHATARFRLTADDLAFPGRDLVPVLEAGLIEIFVGSSADSRQLQKTPLIVEL